MKSMRARKGLTLIEVVVAVTILMAIFASLLGVFAQGARSMRKSMLVTTALFLAQAELENATLSSTNHSSNIMTNDAQFNSAFNSTEETGVPPGSLYRFTATVSWEGEQGSRSLTLETLRTNY